MLRQLHSLSGLIATLLLVVLALSGTVLSLDPALERLGATVPADGRISVATLAGRVAQHYATVEQIERKSSGSIIVYYTQNGQPGVDRVDPLSGRGIAPYAPSTFSRWVKDLHRSLLADTPGRAVVGITALTMLVLCISGAVLLARRVGGWRHIGRPLHGGLTQRWHAQVGRIAVLGLLLSALTGIYMSAVTFGFISDGMQSEADFPQEKVGGPAAPITALPALLATDLNDLRELVYPNPNDPSDVYSLQTAQGEAYVDQASGALLSYRAHDNVRRTYELIYQLHTGEGLWWLGLLLGLCALSVPLMSATGALTWWQRRQSKPRIAHNSGAQSADTIVLVGSENNSTWGFANVLHEALRQAGLRVHTAPMNQLASEYRSAERLFILTSTYGDGDAPSSANQFLTRLAKAKVNPKLGFVVLGFGDRQFPQFCKFAKDTEAALVARGWRPLLALETIDRQSTQAFARWGNKLGRLIGRELTLLHTPKRPRTDSFQLVERIDYGEQVDAPTSILRFTAVARSDTMGRLIGLFGGNRLPYFEAGDLVGILPPGSPIPRFYSLATGSSDGVLEICVRRHPEGLCSRFLHGLKVGDRIDGFIQLHPDFRPASGKAPVILIGAGTGIGPLAGFIRHNEGKHPMYLYWGGRDPASDFLYEPELNQYLADGRLTQLHAAFSRVQDGAYVQERIVDDATQMRQLIESGAQVLVCGSRAMANSIIKVLDEILAPLNLDVSTLKMQGRFREDVF
ncbi:putative Oxidoreductase, FAD-binding [Aromatoleum aromaticum EbN1]|uniref:Oxidoreductase, FAD-binding n=1 Tax=Aromatoleum aromaticum (strain DSM 19018 / LMG 30748 / EbN1) TaxID=76114 RepID=Q5P442_AROAE|nr:PepSY domain-containing protein [Aromatoleum aromaticum]CAI07921.1 putative Oxidoreductase, FAD-binding [Aromatoleum aromaticum EbN1]